MHPIRGAAPVQKRCIAYGSGAAPQYTRTNAELANRATPHHNQPEHRTPGGHRADVEQLCCTLLTLPHRKSHPQHHLTSNRAQTVVRFAPNTLFQPDFTEVDCTLDTPSRTGNHTTTRTARAKTPPVGFGRASGRTLRTKRGARSRGRPGPKAPTTRATIRQPGAAFVLNTSAYPDPTDGGAGTRPTLPPIELTHTARGLGDPQSADSAAERAEIPRPRLTQQPPPTLTTHSTPKVADNPPSSIPRFDITRLQFRQCQHFIEILTIELHVKRQGAHKSALLTPNNQHRSPTSSARTPVPNAPHPAAASALDPHGTRGPHGARTRKEPRPRPTGIGDEAGAG